MLLLGLLMWLSSELASFVDLSLWAIFSLPSWTLQAREVVRWTFSVQLEEELPLDIHSVTSTLVVACLFFSRSSYRWAIDDGILERNEIDREAYQQKTCIERISTRVEAYENCSTRCFYFTECLCLLTLLTLLSVSISMATLPLIVVSPLVSTIFIVVRQNPFTAILTITEKCIQLEQLQAFLL